MMPESRNNRLDCPPVHIAALLIITTVLIAVQYLPKNSIATNIFYNAIITLSTPQTNQRSTFSRTEALLIQVSESLETTVQCVGPLYNQSCLFKNLYYANSEFLVLTVKRRKLPSLAVRTDAFVMWDVSPTRRDFDSYEQLEKFVRHVANPMIIPDLTLHFSQHLHHEIGHALFDGLYPAYLGLIRFAPRHLRPFRLLVGLDHCDDCWSEDVYSRFAGLGIIKLSVLKSMSIGRWYLFDELIMGSGTMCQRCTQPNLQLAGGVELDGSKLFRDRMYKQHGLIPPVSRRKNSAESRRPQDPLIAYIIDNKRFTAKDKEEIGAAIIEINKYTNTHSNKTIKTITSLKWPLIHVSYVSYGHIKARHTNLTQFNVTRIDSRPPAYELTQNNFMAQLQILRTMDIYVTGPDTGQMYQTFLSDGSVSINLGGIKPRGQENTKKVYASFLGQQMTAGAPYIKGLYYPINERPKGIKKDEVIKLIRKAAQLILNGFSIPVNPRDNLAPDGQLFTEMCEKDKDFCNLVTTRLRNRDYACIDLWVEDLVHEQNQWKDGGYIDRGIKIICPFNRTLLLELRRKYRIDHTKN